MNNETITKILALPPGGRIWVKRDGAPEWPTDTLTMDDLIELARKVQGYEEMMEEAGQIEFADPSEPFYYVRRDGDGWHGYKTSLGETGDFDTAFEAFQALKEKV